MAQKELQNIQLEKQIKQIQKQQEIEKRAAFAHISKWLNKGANHVPRWMLENNYFITSLRKVKNGDQYMKLLKTFGRHFLLNQSQCRTILSQNNETQERVNHIVKVLVIYIKLINDN